MFSKLLEDVGSIGKNIASSIFPDPKDELKRIKIEQQITESLLKSSTSIIKDEVKGTWLQANWRPITMLTFVALISAKWLGLTEPIAEIVELEILAIVKVGLGGYVLGRSAEKAIKEWKK